MADFSSAQFPDSITHAQLKELLRIEKQKKAAIVYDPYEYKDEDTFKNELNELYSYEERFDWAPQADQFAAAFPNGPWDKASDKTRREFVLSRLDNLEAAGAAVQKASALALLYIAQGTPLDHQIPEEHIDAIKTNCLLLRKLGTVQGILTALHQGWSTATDWQVVSYYLQILSIILIAGKGDNKLVDEFAHPMQPNLSAVTLLFDVLGAIADGRIPRGFPLKKLLVCLRHAMLTCWGNGRKLNELKEAARANVGLPPIKPGVYLKWTMDDLERFERDTASRYYGFNRLADGAKTLTDLENSLPVPIREGLQIMRSNVYVSLGEVQLKAFTKEKMPRFPWPASAVKTPANSDELLTRIENISKDLATLLSHLPRNSVTMLKLLLASLPSAKKTQGALSLLNDLEMHPHDGSSKGDIEAALKAEVDASRHREIICKSIAAILILLLKHSRIVHVLHFELIAQLLIDNNCLLLLLRFFNQDLGQFISTRAELWPYTFLSYATSPREQLADDEMAAEGKTETEISSMESPEPLPPIYVSHRNAYTTVTLLRVLQKLTKRKLGRVRTLMEYKAPAILRRVAKLPHDKLSMYAVKIIKSQLPYLGRKWRTSNMKIVSAIYMDLRTRSPDAALLSASSDADGEDLPSAGTDELHAVIEEFVRAIGLNGLPTVEEEDDDDMTSLSLRHIDLGMGFTQNYEAWLENEVYNEDTDARPVSPV